MTIFIRFHTSNNIAWNAAYSSLNTLCVLDFFVEKIAYKGFYDADQYLFTPYTNYVDFARGRIETEIPVNILRAVTTYC